MGQWIPFVMCLLAWQPVSAGGPSKTRSLAVIRTESRKPGENRRSPDLAVLSFVRGEGCRYLFSGTVEGRPDERRHFVLCPHSVETFRKVFWAAIPDLERTFVQFEPVSGPIEMVLRVMGSGKDDFEAIVTEGAIQFEAPNGHQLWSSDLALKAILTSLPKGKDDELLEAVSLPRRQVLLYSYAPERGRVLEMHESGTEVVFSDAAHALALRFGQFSEESSP